MTEAFDGLERTYYLHLPAGYKSSGKLPVVLVFHGGGRGDGGSVGFSGKNRVVKLLWQSGLEAEDKGWPMFLCFYHNLCRILPL